MQSQLVKSEVACRDQLFLSQRNIQMAPAARTPPLDPFSKMDLYSVPSVNPLGVF
jgi:hypothetical protein